MKWVGIIVLCALYLLLEASVIHGRGTKKVAIIGGGIGGAATSFFLQEQGVEVTVFERSEEVGGRSASVPYPGSSREQKMMEIGAGILYTGNKYLYNMSLQLGLHHLASPPRSFGLWDGDSFAFRSGSTKLRTKILLLWRYGLSLLRLSKIVKGRLSDFNKIYELQMQGRAFDKPEDLWGAVGLYSLTQTSIEAYLQRQGLSKRIRSELVAAVNRRVRDSSC
jgi:prenylcysteine oxidase/farnesylcysteine lyase